MLITILISLMMALVPLSEVETEHYSFGHLGREEGLAGLHVFSIRQTPDGALWWASKNNVNRYNGNRIQHYRLDEGIPYNALSGRTIMMATAPDGSLYAYDNKGKIFLYDSYLNRFDLVTDIAGTLGESVILNYMLVGDDGFWLATDRGAYQLRDGRMMPVVENRFANLIQPSSGGMLICTTDGVFNTDGEKVYSQNVVSGYYEEATGALWLGTFAEGVIVRRPGMGSVGVVGIPKNPVRALVPYHGGMLAGVDGFGVYTVSAYKAQKLFDANDGPQGVLHGNGVYALLTDNMGDIFIGSYSGGIDMARPSSGAVQVLRRKTGSGDELRNGHVNCVTHLSDGRLLMGTDDGASILDEASGKWQHVAPGLVVLSALEEPGGDILLASFGKGVWRVGRGGSAVQAYSVENGVLRDNHVYSLYNDNRGNLWMGCLDGDLVCRTNGAYRYYPVRNVQSILQLPDGKMAIATAAGVKLINTEDGAIETLDYCPEGADPNTINLYVLHLFLSGNELWMGTDGGGAYVYDLGNGQCRQYTSAEGLPGNSVSSVGADAVGDLWIATDVGLGVLRGGVLRPYNLESDIDREYCRGAQTLLEDGRILLGSADGALLLDPRKLERVGYSAPLHLLGVKYPGRSEKEQMAKNRLLRAEQRLNLGYRQNTFELHFESVSLHFPGDVTYRYQLDGGEWSEPVSQEYIRFAGMESGTHSVAVASFSRSSGAQLDLKEIIVNIGNPWWNTWWMWTVYVTLFLIACWCAWRIYTLHIKYNRLIMDNPVLRSLDSTPAPDDDLKEDGGNRDFVDSATRVVVEHLAEPEFTIDDLCREMGMSRTNLYMHLKTYTGKGPQDFIRMIRLERAALLLRSGHSVVDVAVMVGFDNPKYFSTVFKKYFEVSPSKFR